MCFSGPSYVATRQYQANNSIMLTYILYTIIILSCVVLYLCVASAGKSDAGSLFSTAFQARILTKGTAACWRDYDWGGGGIMADSLIFRSRRSRGLARAAV